MIYVILVIWIVFLGFYADLELNEGLIVSKVADKLGFR